MKKLENLKWKPMWTTHISCLIGCKNYLEVPVSDAAIFGGTGHTFILNMHEECCPSGPTAWMTGMIFQLGQNLGLNSGVVFSEKNHPDFAEKQKEAFEFAKSSIDRGIPCYGWELDMAEYFIIHGYDENGYYVSGPNADDGKGPIAWNTLGTSEIGLLEVYNVQKGTVKSPEVILHNAFDAALKHARNTENWILPNYRSGLAGYDWWIAALEEGKADQMGHSYNAAVWAECRAFAVKFLEEFADKVSGQHQVLLQEALAQYTIIAAQLKILTELYPFNFQFEDRPWPIDDRSHQAVAALKEASAAEADAFLVMDAYLALG